MPSRPGTSKKNGFKAQLDISPELKQFLGREKVSRPQLTKLMWAYFKSHKLMDPQDQRFVVCDDKLKALTGEDRFKAFSFMKLLNKHIVKPGGAAAGEGTSKDVEEADAAEDEEMQQEQGEGAAEMKEETEAAPVKPEETAAASAADTAAAAPAHASEAPAAVATAAEPAGPPAEEQQEATPAEPAAAAAPEVPTQATEPAAEGTATIPAADAPAA